MNDSEVFFIAKNISSEAKEEMAEKLLRGSSPGGTFTVSQYDPGDDEVLQGCTHVAETGLSNYYWNGVKKVWVDEDGSKI